MQKYKIKSQQVTLIPKSDKDMTQKKKVTGQYFL